MKKDIHPESRPVLFMDQTHGGWFLIPSTVSTRDKGICPGDNKEYPLVRVPISSLSHRLWTGAVQFLDTEGRLEKFANKFKNKAVQQKADLAKQEEATKVKAVKNKKQK